MLPVVVAAVGWELLLRVVTVRTHPHLRIPPLQVGPCSWDSHPPVADRRIETAAAAAASAGIGGGMVTSVVVVAAASVVVVVVDSNRRWGWAARPP